jgi:hypothetical protein
MPIDKASLRKHSVFKFVFGLALMAANSDRPRTFLNRFVKLL